MGATSIAYQSAIFNDSSDYFSIDTTNRTTCVYHFRARVSSAKQERANSSQRDATRVETRERYTASLGELTT